jgi:hypothetical protein
MTTTAPLLEHALLTDTDDLPGGGGYSLVWASPGTSAAQRRFVADHASITDYLHRHDNARMYFSVLPVTRGLYAFVRRFSIGMRRNGTQNRVFMHTIFLSEESFWMLQGFPWLLAELPIRPIGSGDSTTSLAKLISPASRQTSIDALEWQPPSSDQAHDALRRRCESLHSLCAGSRPPRGLDVEECIARVAGAIVGTDRVTLPQGPVFEQLTLLAWSVLPMETRAVTPWTQHDQSAAGASVFQLANSPSVQSGDCHALMAPTPEFARLFVARSLESASSWQSLNAGLRENNLTWGSSSLEWWLRYSEAFVPIEPASLRELEQWLTRTARSVRKDRNDPWIERPRLLETVWLTIAKQATKGRMPLTFPEWSALAARSGIGGIIFSIPPSKAWLNDNAQLFGADILIQFLVHGTESSEECAATRENVSCWAVEAALNGLHVGSDALALLAVSLSGARSASVVQLVEELLRREDGLRSLESAIPPDPPQMADAVLLATITALDIENSDAHGFASRVLLPYVEGNPSFAASIPAKAMRRIARALRDDTRSFLAFAFALPDARLIEVISAVTEWLDNDEGLLPLAAALIRRATSSNVRPSTLAGLTFRVALAGESSDLWLPALKADATALDLTAAPLEVRKFVDRVRELQPRLTAEREIVENLLLSTQKVASGLTRIGPCTRALFMATRNAWPQVRNVAAAAVNAIVASPMHHASEWESCVMELLYELRYETRARKAFTTFWLRLGAHEISNLQDSTVQALYFVEGADAEQIVLSWSRRVGSLPFTYRADRFIDALRAIGRARAPDLELALSERSITNGSATANTFSRQDLALWCVSATDRYKKLAAGISQSLKALTAPQRLLRLLDLFASSCTWPSTRHALEEHVLPEVLRSLSVDDWMAMLHVSPDAFFGPSDHILMEVIRRVAALKDDRVTERYAIACAHRERWTGIEVARDVSRGRVNPMPTGRQGLL